MRTSLEDFFRLSQESLSERAKELIRRLVILHYGKENPKWEQYLYKVYTSIKDTNKDFTEILVRFFPEEFVAREIADVFGLEFSDDVPEGDYVVGKYSLFDSLNNVVYTTVFSPRRLLSEVYGKVRDLSSLRIVVIPLRAYNGYVFERKKKSEEEILRDIEELMKKGNALEYGSYLLNYFLEQAVYYGASDVHLEYAGEIGIVRFRVGGSLETVASLKPTVYTAVINSLKTAMGTNQLDKYTIKDGRISYSVPGTTFSLDVRIAIAPAVPESDELTTHERAVLRLLRKDGVSIFSLEKLGFEPQEVEIIEGAIKISAGLIITSGPTGSGKTTTLYAILSKINALERKVITIENPVEFMNPYVWTQHQVRKDSDFDDFLKIVLREDPDVVLVGEVRDPKSLSALVQMANTGHLTFTTVHANNSLEVVRRLEELGARKEDVKEFGVLFMAQRLLRLSCPHCRRKRRLNLAEKKLLGLPEGFDEEVTYNEGCDRCNYTGYQKKRRLIVELLPLYFKEVKEKVFEENPGYFELFSWLENEYGLKSMVKKAVELSLRGEVSIDEVLEKAR